MQADELQLVGLNLHGPHAGHQRVRGPLEPPTNTHTVGGAGPVAGGGEYTATAPTRPPLTALVFTLCVWMLVTHSCPTICKTMDCSPPGSSAHGILQARILEWVAMPSSRGSSPLMDQTWVSCIAGRFFTV